MNIPPFGSARGAWLIALLCVANLSVSAAQTGASNATEGRRFVPATLTSGLCTTRVSPGYPAGTQTLEPATVTLRVVLSRSGRLTPLYRVLGPANLELQAMNAVRLWKCKPYTTAGSPLDVLTEVQVKFVPGQPAGFLTHGSE